MQVKLSQVLEMINLHVNYKKVVPKEKTFPIAKEKDATPSNKFVKSKVCQNMKPHHFYHFLSIGLLIAKN
jgi:hypothetical protein